MLNRSGEARGGKPELTFQVNKLKESPSTVDAQTNVKFKLTCSFVTSARSGNL